MSTAGHPFKIFSMGPQPIIRKTTSFLMLSEEPILRDVKVSGNKKHLKVQVYEI
jgi:hypothetical protein